LNVLSWLWQPPAPAVVPCSLEEKRFPDLAAFLVSIYISHQYVYQTFIKFKALIDFTH